MAFVDHFAREAREKQKKNIDPLPKSFSVCKGRHTPYRLFSLYWYVWKELNLDWVPLPCWNHVRRRALSVDASRQASRTQWVPLPGLRKGVPDLPANLRSSLLDLEELPPGWTRRWCLGPDADRGSNTCLSLEIFQTLVSMGFLNRAHDGVKWKHTPEGPSLLG